MIIDILIITTLFYAFYRGFAKGVGKQLQNVLQLFVGLYLANHFAIVLAKLLIKWQILHPINYASSRLIGFLIIFSLYYLLFKSLKKLYQNYLKTKVVELQKLFFGSLMLLWVLFLWVYGSFLAIQIAPLHHFRSYLLKQSIIYPYFYSYAKKSLTKNLVSNITSGTINAREIFIKSLPH